MNKHVWQRILSATLCLGILASNAYATQIPTADASPAAHAQAPAGRTHTISHSKNDLQDFIESQAVQDGDILLLEGSATINTTLNGVDQGDNPYIIKKRITFRGASKDGKTPTLVVRPGGILLGNDVSFEDMEINLANPVRNVIMANGHKLTLKNVTQSQGAQQVNVAGGGLTTASASSPSGSVSQVNISGKVALANIYGGNISHVDWNPQDTDPLGPPSNCQTDVTIRIENLTSGSKIGEIYASGARQTPYDPNTMLDTPQMTPPKADPQRYQATGSIEIYLNGSAVSKIYGTASDSNKAYVHFSGDHNLNSNLMVKDAASFHADAGRVAPNLISMENASLEVKSGASLYLSNLQNKTVGDFAGGGLLVMEPKDTLVINGTIAGNTKIALGSLSDETESKKPPIEKQVYISAKNSASTSAPDAFQLVPFKSNPKWKLAKTPAGEWIATTKETVSTEKVTSVSTTKPELHTSKWESSVRAPLNVTYETPDAAPSLKNIPIEVKLDNEVISPRADSSGNYSYTSKYSKNLKLQFISANEGQGGKPVDVLVISPQKTPFNPDTTYQLEMTVPAQYTTTNQPITFQTILHITENTPPPVPVEIDLSKAQIMVQGDSFVYTGQAHTPEVTVVSDQGAPLQKDVHYTLSHENNIDAGQASAIITAKPDGGCINTQTVHFTIGKAPLTPQTAVVAEKIYDGTKTAAVTDVTFQNGSNQAVALTKEQYAVSGTFNSENVGLANQVTATVTLLGKAADNYTLTQRDVTVPATIKQAQTTSQSGRVDVTNKHEASYTYSLSRLLSPLGNGTTYGSTEYSLGAVTLNQYAGNQPPSIEGEILTIPIANVQSEEEMQVGTIEINIKSENYLVDKATIQIFSANKQVPTGAPTLSENSFVYGKPLSHITLSGNLTDGMGGIVEGNFQWEEPTKVYSAGTHQPNWIFTPNDTEQYQTVTEKATIIVEKATPVGEPRYFPITEDNKTLQDANLTTGTFDVDGTIAWDVDSSTVVKKNEAYSWTFTPTDAGNYHKCVGTIILYTSSDNGGDNGGGNGGGDNGGNGGGDNGGNGSNGGGSGGNGGSSGGSGGSGGSGSGTQTNPDGSTTKVEHSGNSVITTTTHPNGSVNRVETKKDGTVIETNTTEHGTVGKLITDSNDSITEASGRVSKEAAKISQEKNEPVRIPIELPASVSRDKAPSIKVDIPTGGIMIEIPVEQLTAGAVLVIVSPDGKETLARQTKLTKDGVAVELQESSTLKLLDNSQSFSDVSRGNWYVDAVDFVSARELMNGTVKNTFQPNTTLSRGMFAVMLHNLENNPKASHSSHFVDVPSDSWFTTAINWAAETGIMSGNGNGTAAPNKDITREQLAVMLYHYAGSPAVTPSLHGFADESTISPFAKSAITWAVENGIVSGKANNQLDPRGQATRAEAAQMIMNFMNK